MIEAILTIFLMFVLIFIFEIWPRTVNKRLFNEEFINSIVKAFNLKEKSKRRFVGKKSEYRIEMLFISPSLNHFMNKPIIRIFLDYKPEKEIKKQELKIEYLRKKYPEFIWVANAIYLDVEVQKNYPTVDDLLNCLENMEQIIRKENLVTISESESDQYGEDWDSEMMM